MSGRISLSAKTARALLDAVDALTEYEVGTSGKRAAEELRAALKPRLSKPMRRARVEGIRAERAAKKAAWGELKAAVFARAGGNCELCRVRPAVDPHHAFGGSNRKAMESVRSVIAVCRRCHDAITENRDPEAWAIAQREHFRRHGFEAEYAEMQRRLDEIRAKRALDEGRKAGGAR